MNKTINRHLRKRGVIFAKRTDEPMTFSERAPKFIRWFSESVMGFDSEEYRKEFWREARRRGRTIGHIPYTIKDHLNQKRTRHEMALPEMIALGLLMGGSFAIWIMRREIDRHLHRLRRPSYYETERNRRLNLTHERRRIRHRSTNNPCPTAEQLKRAFIHARNSVENMIRLGSLMEDLECYVDNSLVFGEHGKIIARKGGIKRYIQEEIPDLYASYKTLMRYKALAKKFRQAIGIKDPTSASTVLPDEDEENKNEYKPITKDTEKTSDTKRNDREETDRNEFENMVRTKSQQKGKITKDLNVKRVISESNDEIRKKVKDILCLCEGTFLNLSATIALRISEDFIPHHLSPRASSSSLFSLHFFSR